MIYKSLLVLLIPVFFGYVFLSLLWRARNVWQFVLKIFLGIGVGFGINSYLYFVWLLLFNRQDNFGLLQSAIIIPMVMFLLYRDRVNRFNENMIGYPLIAGSFLLVLMVLAGTWLFADRFINKALIFPHGGRDAQAIWNLRARFIYRAGADWKVAFSPDLDPRFHADYPLLIPLNVVWAWNFLGEESTRVPMIFSGLYTLGVVGVAFGLLSSLKSVGQAALGSLTLMAMPLLFLTGIMQIGDVPMAYYMLAATAFLILYLTEKKAGFIALAGLMAGLSAWTKNEGLLFALSATAGCLLLSILNKDNWNALKYFAIGIALPLAVVLYFKMTLAPASDLFVNPGVGPLIGRIFETSNYLIIFGSIGRTLMSFDFWNVGSPLILLIYLIILGTRVTPSIKRGVYFGFLILFLQFVGYVLIYIFTPYDLQWHLNYSVERLMLHLMLSVVTLVFLIAPTPEEIFQILQASDKTNKVN